MRDKGIKILVEISRIILGATFIFSGFVKTVDPFGTAYKIEDYFAAFGLTSLSFMSFPLSALQGIIEFAMGACMLFGIYRRWNSRLTLIVMVFMTFLTFYLAIANPVDDCGCFGDFLIITNWQTFYKNIVLLLCAAVVFIYPEKISNLFTGKTYWLAFLYIIIFISLFTFRNYIYEPLFDFRPYRIGANIPELNGIDEGKGREEKTMLLYAKDGVEKEFTEDNIHGKQYMGICQDGNRSIEKRRGISDKGLCYK
ncbi:BT_3928 family protein [Prevotella sp. 10(H)]|uniref:BT_3928 family protein n=1 Tax=Prevotella sp. 10(H) TaxID=1158294 RepID=UPI000A7FBA54|nr:BT_3928 family protein [Prevotella sp. 10(H)]